MHRDFIRFRCYCSCTSFVFNCDRSFVFSSYSHRMLHIKRELKFNHPWILHFERVLLLNRWNIGSFNK